MSSLVCILDIENNDKLVLKIPLSTKGAKSEGTFLKVWEGLGVSVPHVLEEGVIDEHSYILMKYIDAPTLTEFYKISELTEQKIFVAMGSVLRKMHGSEAIGFGRLYNDKPEFLKFKDWLHEEHNQQKFTYVKENKLLNVKDHVSLEKACNILVDFVSINERSAYCHNDFASANIFATDPFTVFDPDPTFNHPFIDLARAIVIGTSFHGPEVVNQLIQGYFKNEEYDIKIIQAAVLLETCLKFPYWHKTKQDKRISTLQNYLSEQSFT